MEDCGGPVTVETYAVYHGGAAEARDTVVLVEIDTFVLGVRYDREQDAGGKQDIAAHHFMILMVLPPERSRYIPLGRSSMMDSAGADTSFTMILPLKS